MLPKPGYCKYVVTIEGKKYAYSKKQDIISIYLNKGKLFLIKLLKPNKMP